MKMIQFGNFYVLNKKTKFDQLKKGDVEIKLQILESFLRVVESHLFKV